MSEENIGESLAGAENFRKIDDLSVLRGIIHQLRMSNEEYESENAELENRLSVLEPRRSEGRGMSEMSKVEEVARIVAMDMCDQWHREAEFTLDEVNGDTLDRAISVARKSIEAMRCPTEAMLAAGSFVLEGLTEEDAKRLGEEEHFQSGAWRAEEVLSAMLDAALKE